MEASALGNLEELPSFAFKDKNGLIKINNKTELVFVSKCFYGLNFAKFAFESPNFMIFYVLSLLVFNRYNSFLKTRGF